MKICGKYVFHILRILLLSISQIRHILGIKDFSVESSIDEISVPLSLQSGATEHRAVNISHLTLSVSPD